MMQRTVHGVASLLATLFLAAHVIVLPAGAGQEKIRKPNFLVVLTDDHGYGDLGCYGHPLIKTPNLDKLAVEGLRLTAAYSAGSVCSPSRAGLMTGRTPYRVGVYGAIPEQSYQMERLEVGSPMHLRRQEITIASLLKSAGYQTAVIGKWHLNGLFNSPKQPQPSDHGFDYWFCTQNNAQPNHLNPFNFVRNGTRLESLSGYSSTLIVDEAIKWLTRERKKDEPFFLYVPFHAPHEHIATAEEFIDLYYPANGDLKKSACYGNITQMDHEFGRLMRAVDELGLREQTLVLFTSDNGPAFQVPHPYGSAGVLRSQKGSVYEGGVRVPGIIRWPGRIKPGQTSAAPFNGTDLLPTLCEIVGIDLPQDRPLDGASFLPALEGRPVRREAPLYWQYMGVLPGEPNVAMRDGDWKILARLTPEPFDQKGRHDVGTYMPAYRHSKLHTFELYNLVSDMGEQNDLSTVEVKKLEEMTAKLKKLYNEIKTEGPSWPSFRTTDDPVFEIYPWVLRKK